MWNKLDKVSRFALVVGLALWPFLARAAGDGRGSNWASGLLVDVVFVGFLWALAEGLKAVFIPR